MRVDIHKHERIEEIAKQVGILYPCIGDPEYRYAVANVYTLEKFGDLYAESVIELNYLINLDLLKAMNRIKELEQLLGINNEQ